MIMTQGEKMVWAAEFVRSRQVVSDKLLMCELQGAQIETHLVLTAIAANAAKDAWHAVQSMRRATRHAELQQEGHMTDGQMVLLRCMLGEEE